MIVQMPAAQPAPAPASAQVANASQVQVRHPVKMNKSIKIEHPSAALIEYLGDYEDAADGLDAMGLAAHPDSLSETGKDGQQR